MEDQSDKKTPSVGIVGAGLVGALNACYFAKRGYDVHLFEYRKDIRQMEHVPGRSINLALSIRGREALRRMGLEEEVVFRHGIPMHSRMIHNKDGTKRQIPYGKKDQCIYSVGRRFLNETLLSAAEKYPNVKVHFEHKLLRANLDTGKLQFLVEKAYEKEDTVDLIVGNDGAFSTIRKEMLKRSRFNYSQYYIPHAYKELCMPPDKDGKFAMEKNFLHIWPRGQFMMIALPNQDVSWTMTLFMPFDIFESLDTEDKLVTFFEEQFPDSIPLIGKERLISDFFKVPHSPLIMVKCFPYHIGTTSLIMGDAAHAMVPFYGQGMNCGLEDCLVLDDIMTKYDNDLVKVLPEFSDFRNPDAEAICDLAMYNYIEMRDLVNSKFFLLRKYFDNFLNKMFPNTWIPLYTMVTFSRIRYHECIAKKKWQDKLVDRLVLGTGVCLVTAVAISCRGYFKRITAESFSLLRQNLTNLISHV